MYRSKNLIFCILLILFNQGFGQSSSDIDKTITENNSKAQAYLSEAGKENAAAQLYNQSAFLLRSAGRLDEAATYYQKVLDINIAAGNKRGQMTSHNSLAMLYLEAERYENAITHLKKELEFRRPLNIKTDIVNVLTNLAIAENEISAYDAAILDIEKAISISKELNDLVLLKQGYGVAYEIYEKMGNAARSRTYFEMYSAINKKLKEQKMNEISNEADRKVNIAESERKETQQKLQLTNQELEKTVTTLHQVEELTREQRMEIELKEVKISEQNALLRAERLQRRIWLIGFSISLIFIVILSYMVFRIVRANREISEQKVKLEKQNKEIQASIRYAQTIQQALLPPHSEIEKYFDSFIVYLPKDIVSGDFYWITTVKGQKKKIVYIGVIDCTGHGVPGAFMSMIGNRLLSEIVSEKEDQSPGQILESLNSRIREALRQEETDNNDGMDVALCRFDLSDDGSKTLTFAGAKRPIYILKNKEIKLVTHNGDRKSIGGYNLSKKDISFSNFTEKVDKDDMVYLFSDGIIDQNGPDRKKFGRIRMEEAMIDCASLKPSEQKVIFEQRLQDYMSDEEQRDDISLIGLKIV